VRVVRLFTCLCLALAVVSTGCSEETEIQRHREKLESLGATTEALGLAWLAGKTSATYTGTALTQTLQLVESERSGLGRSAAALADPAGAELSQSAEKLSRLLGALIQAVQRADHTSVHRHVSEIPILPREQP